MPFQLTWRWFGRIFSVLAAIVLLIWFYQEGGYEPLYQILSTLATLFIGLSASQLAPDKPIQFRSDPATLTERQLERNRESLLKQVHNGWIKDVLEQSITGQIIELYKDYVPDVVLPELDRTIQRPTGGEEPVPRGTSALEIFEKAPDGLVITGQPGAGKTTLLLELARDLIKLARPDERRRIPVVLPLASWGAEPKPLHEWLGEELNRLYKVYPALSQHWLENDDLILLLDGLDEVNEDVRDDCVQAINAFHASAGATPLVVTCRSEELDALSPKLSLGTAIHLQPLHPEQVTAYLDALGPETATLRDLLATDEDLRKLARTPLMLSVMLGAYAGQETQDIPHFEDSEQQRSHIFERYVQRALHDHPRQHRDDFLPEETVQRLAFIAHRMNAHGQAVFLGENLQPSWLDEKVRQWFGLSVGLVVSLVLALAVYPFSVITVWVLLGESALVTALVVGLVFTLAMILILTLAGRSDSRFKVSEVPQSARFNQGIFILWKNFWKTIAHSSLYLGIITGLSGLGAGLVIGLRYGSSVRLDIGLVALLFGIVFGALGGLMPGLLEGGAAFIAHYVLRWFLWREHNLPIRQLPAFLDFCTSRVLMYRVGGGYRFIHRYLQDYFAEQYAPAQADTAS